MRNLLKYDGEYLKPRDIMLYNRWLADKSIFNSTRKNEKFIKWLLAQKLSI